jgi:hypothetical protein
LGREEAIVTIHGGLGREERKKAEEGFKHDPQVRILLATDAAGEGINLHHGKRRVALPRLAATGKVQSFGRGRARRWMTPPVPGFTTTLLLPAPLPSEY